MARHERIVVAATPTLLSSAEADPTPGSALLIKNVGSQTVFIGSDTVTSTDGYPLEVGETLASDLAGVRDRLYGRVASGTSELRALRTGV